MHDWYKLYVLTEGSCGDDDAFIRHADLAIKQYWYAIRSFALLLLECETIVEDELERALCDAIYTSEYEFLPLPSQVCPLDLAAYTFPNRDDLEARSEALRAEAELEARTYELGINVRLEALRKTLRTGAKLEPREKLPCPPVSKLASIARMSPSWSEGVRQDQCETNSDQKPKAAYDQVAAMDWSTAGTDHPG